MIRKLTAKSSLDSLRRESQALAQSRTRWRTEALARLKRHCSSRCGLGSSQIQQALAREPVPKLGCAQACTRRRKRWRVRHAERLEEF